MWLFQIYFDNLNVWEWQCLSVQNNCVSLFSGGVLLIVTGAESFNELKLVMFCVLYMCL